MDGCWVRGGFRERLVGLCAQVLVGRQDSCAVGRFGFGDVSWMGGGGAGSGGYF